MTLVVGVTGTRSGMNSTQFDEFLQFFKKLVADNDEVIVCHGDCIGVDAEVAEIAKSFDCKIICFPPEKTDLRAWVTSDEYREPMSYFKRNRAIVDFCDILLVIPYQDSHQTHGGTWYTHDYAVKNKKPIQIFYPKREKILMIKNTEKFKFDG